MARLTAWVGLHRVAQIRAGETLAVSAAAGTVGAAIIQLAATRRCRTVGITKVRELASAGVAMLPRGGGLSYTNAYLSDRPGTVVVDATGLDRIIEINETDR